LRCRFGRFTNHSCESYGWFVTKLILLAIQGSIQDALPEEDYVQTSFEVGDLLIFSAFLVHRSGDNITQNIRWSIQLRYNNMAEPTFQERGFPMPYIYKPEENLVTPDFPKKEQLEQLFA
jgi:ectoine hydroxylase-related dioxygenase (phytanoyl-CoA dioxygenase family)